MRMTLIIFPKKFCLGLMDHFGPKNGTSHNSRSDVRIFLNFAQWKEPIGRLK